MRILKYTRKSVRHLHCKRKRHKTLRSTRLKISDTTILLGTLKVLLCRDYIIQEEEGIIVILLMKILTSIVFLGIEITANR